MFSHFGRGCEGEDELGPCLGEGFGTRGGGGRGGGGLLLLLLRLLLLLLLGVPFWLLLLA